ncbi:Gfo/Idh/MocA family protein [Planomicrobium sp. CPCC 101079]|uniref:Gfo/Idh/MocA family protein n=1 Tax=Planomicrobium sp. CPCC 101079 TaxID=2599618 RepID=UPI0011B46C94|nr:Gfo/Idh/MocA family oxidoreductase [Planomicrobium sp. CPCC 101079]TWT13135.1 Gfo/Idh/MocA family oxidoreductase [Planomicrobium sp. CPCC 101079]
MRTLKIGIIGCGYISSIYMENVRSFNHLSLVACADLDLERAFHQARRYGIPKACTVQELLADQDIDLVINLTIPKVHAEICLLALEAGKHVYVEKPLAANLSDAKLVLERAKEKGLFVGSAPDTFLGAGIQTALELIERGEISTPVGASAFMINRGHEHWHPNPAFYYEKGGGPMFDMGPYYLTALIALLGPIKRLSGSARISYPQRTVLSEPNAGEKITVTTETHISGTIDFVAGAVGTITTSFDAFGGSSLPPIEIYGSEGTLLVPDPNTFGGPVQLRKKDEEVFTDISLLSDVQGNCRGIGVAEMAHAIVHGNAHRANGELAYHVLEAMHGFHASSHNNLFHHMESTCQKPEPFSISTQVFNYQ